MSGARFNPARIQANLTRWEAYMRAYHLPTWEQLPDMPLYMAQVVVLVNRYLDFIPRNDKETTQATPSVVNNYVRLRLMPAPVRKRYDRVHLAYLIIICTLKQTMSIAEIAKLLRSDRTLEEVEAYYNRFCEKINVTAEIFIHQVRSAAGELEGDAPPQDRAKSFVMTQAVSAALYRILTTKLVALGEEDTP